MIRRLFDNFLTDSDVYRAAENYWAELIVDLAQQLGQEQEWRRWIPLTYADGTPIESEGGNPIYDARSDRLSRAIRIMQHPPVGDELELAAWVKHYEEGYSEFPRDELFLNLSASDESVQLARQLLLKWMTPTTLAEEMQGFISRVVPRWEQD